MSDGPSVTDKPRPFSGLRKLGLLGFGGGPTRAEVDEWFRDIDARLDRAEKEMDVLLAWPARSRLK